MNAPPDPLQSSGNSSLGPPVRRTAADRAPSPGASETGPDGNEWAVWHQRYVHEPHLQQRLRLVQHATAQALDEAPPGPVRLLSLCAGDGRDVLPVLSEHPRGPDVDAVLVELDPPLAEAARAASARIPAGRVRVVRADAGLSDSFAGAVPAEIVLACGVFGNVTDADVERTVRRLPELCAPRATVVWTRGRFPPDLTPAIRGWFSSAGFEERAFLPIPDSLHAVGAHRLVRPPDPYRPGERWFSFLPFDERPSNRGRSARPPG